MNFLKKYLPYILSALAAIGIGLSGWYWWTHRALPATAPTTDTPNPEPDPSSLTYAQRKHRNTIQKLMPIFPSSPMDPGTSGPQLSGINWSQVLQG